MFKLLPETLFLTVFVIDRYLEKAVVARDKLQLVGITAMFVASKYEEIHPPEIHDFVFICDNTYTKENLHKMEELLLITLSWNLGYPSPLHFLRRFSKASESDYSVHTLGKFIIEISLLDCSMLKYLPSEIAAAAVYISRKIVGALPAWTPTLVHYTTYSVDRVHAVALELNELLKKMRKSGLIAISEKYGSGKNGHVSQVELVEL